MERAGLGLVPWNPAAQPRIVIQLSQSARRGGLFLATFAQALAGIHANIIDNRNHGADDLPKDQRER